MNKISKLLAEFYGMASLRISSKLSLNTGKQINLDRNNDCVQILSKLVKSGCRVGNLVNYVSETGYTGTKYTFMSDVPNPVNMIQTHSNLLKIRQLGGKRV